MWLPTARFRTARAPKLTASLAALLALVVAVAATAPTAEPVAAQTDKNLEGPPDIGIEYVGQGATDTQVRFKVTSRRRAPAPAATVTVETLAPFPANKQTFAVPALNTRGDAHEIVYTLDGSCNGHRVRATIDLSDSNAANNRVEAEVCKMKPTPGPSNPIGGRNQRPDAVDVTTGNTGPTPTPAAPLGRPNQRPDAVDVTTGSTGSGASLGNDARDSGVRVGNTGGSDVTDGIDATDISAVPSHLRPGKHTLTFEPVATKNQEVSTMVWRREPSLACRDDELAGPARPSSVGFRNFEVHDDDCTWHQYYQLAFRFDFSDLRGHSFVPVEAELRYREGVYEERGPDGQPVDAGQRFQASCNLRLAGPRGSWDHENARYLGIGYGDTRSQGQVGRFSDVVDLVTPMIQQAGIEQDGLMLIGPNEDKDADNAACMSEVSNITLTFTYVIADR